ncbi:MAG TPA: rhomboid family intramembrane serine protease, partial [Bacillus sp. (in: firmicutes)]|nr:rhomboid family intramembrane serine protease [Bacillus sp. (in: firmicutes)]
GAIFGLFGFYISMIAFRKNVFSKENSQLLITITIISIIMTFLQPNINIIGHLFGFLSGYLIGYFVFRTKKTIV